MTDTSHPVTQSAVEAFAREYLSVLGATIQEIDSRWHVKLPTHVNVEFASTPEFTLLLSDDDEAEDNTLGVLSPTSEFTQQLLDEAGEMAVVGEIALTDDTIGEEYRRPPWILESDLTVVDASFSPYYDRTAVCVFVKIGVETVSEYQTGFFEAVTLDTNTHEQLSGLTQLLTDRYFTPVRNPETTIGGESTETAIELDEDALITVISAAQSAAVEGRRATIEDIRKSASQAANTEFEEYRQLQEQRINDLRSEIASLSDRLGNMSSDVDDARSQQSRVEVLEKRQELKTERTELQEELDRVLNEKERGFNRTRAKIDDRHSIEVTTTPTAATIVSYERGEISLGLYDGDQTKTLQAPYALGVGVTDDVACENCGEQLSEENPIAMMEGSFCCKKCR